MKLENRFSSILSGICRGKDVMNVVDGPSSGTLIVGRRAHKRNPSTLDEGDDFQTPSRSIEPQSASKVVNLANGSLLVESQVFDF